MDKYYACNNVKIYIDDIEILHNGFKLSTRNSKTLISIKSEVFRIEFIKIINKILRHMNWFDIKMIFEFIDNYGVPHTKTSTLSCGLPEGDIYDYDVQEIMSGEFLFEIKHVYGLFDLLRDNSEIPYDPELVKIAKEMRKEYENKILTH